MSRLQVYAGNKSMNGELIRVIIATITQEQAELILGIDYYTFKAYYYETDNIFEIKIATAKPGTIFYKPVDSHIANYKELK